MDSTFTACCRQTLEESTAVQCPSVAYQLAGAKKIQQDLASPETLNRFLDSQEDISLASSCFAGPSSPLACLKLQLDLQHL